MVLCKKIKRIFSVIFVFALVICIGTGGSLNLAANAAKSAQDYQKEYDSAKSEYDKLVNKKASAEDRLKAAQKAYYLLVDQVNDINSQINRVQKEIDKLENEIMKLEKNIDEEQALMDLRYSEFCERLKALYIAGSMNSFQVLMECEDFSDYLVRLEMINKVSAKDAAVIENLVNILDRLNKMQEKLDSDRGALNEKKQALVSKRSILQSKEAEAKKSLSQCESLIAEIKSAQADAKEEMQKALREINKLSASGGIVGTGQLCYPVPSCTTVSCGYYGYANHNGVDFSNGGVYGAPVVAADDGQVVSTNYWTYSYGYHITIDHSNGMKTIYCHLSAIGVSVGQNVKKGQEIGRVGSTGNSTGPHLHFGVVVNGGFVNPFGYL